ncbi:hypothetical protein AB6A40_001905 [Gnathostoma spinigerum]|uniref:Uncharacterized protein n=1 Tax=Gnathostoma spinigerum TaxID=75299 RepID=A0ABD6E7Q2_9BILA
MISVSMFHHRLVLLVIAVVFTASAPLDGNDATFVGENKWPSADYDGENLKKSRNIVGITRGLRRKRQTQMESPEAYDVQQQLAGELR